ncbi:MAG TPA: AmmeMemoRadiSam system protein A [Terriglobales bacterium]|jgi:uncharacterized protein|nr:AmmeMemoRadiSam system protein A [Terriglobales bacterium]
MSPPSDNSTQASNLLTPASHAEYNAEERALLLRLAHQSIESAFEGRTPSFDPPSPHLSEQRGAFTTLYLHGELRGCVGYVFPIASLYRTVAETARAAAFEDRRFHSVRSDEAPLLRISLSILSLLTPIQPQDVIVGRHGLLVSHGIHRGLLLPQVPVDHGWNRETFLNETCRKAGLPANAWRHGADLQGFTAEVFGEPGTENS